MWKNKKFLAVRRVWACWPFGSVVLTVRFLVMWPGVGWEPPPFSPAVGIDHLFKPCFKGLVSFCEDDKLSFHLRSHNILWQYGVAEWTDFAGETAHLFLVGKCALGRVCPHFPGRAGNCIPPFSPELDSLTVGQFAMEGMERGESHVYYPFRFTPKMVT
jgi:hypothetical protein